MYTSRIPIASSQPGQRKSSRVRSVDGGEASLSGASMGGGASRPEEKSRRLRVAAARGDVHAMRRELPGTTKGAPADVNQRDPRTQQIALVLSALGRHLDAAELLLQHGADVDAQDGSGRTALIVAGQNGDTALCNLLLQHGAHRRFVEAAGKTALACALEAGHMDTAQILREYRKGSNDGGVAK